MERPPRRRPKPAAIDISWVSCRGVRSTLPLHTPCLYASIFVTPASAHGQRRRPHRVKTPTDRAGGENPEWDAPLRLYLPGASPPTPEPEASKNKNKKDRPPCDDSSGSEDVLLVRFELKAEVAVLGDVLAASAAVPVPDLVADGQTRRVSYQLAGPDGRHPNGVISFSYAFHERSNQNDDGEPAVAPPGSTASDALLPAATAAAPGLYPTIEWALTEQIPIYLPVPTAAAAAVANSRSYPPPPPPLPEAPACGVYPVVPASGIYPTVDLAPVSVMSCYPPAPPEWDGRCLYG